MVVGDGFWTREAQEAEGGQDAAAKDRCHLSQNVSYTLNFGSSSQADPIWHR